MLQYREEEVISHYSVKMAAVGVPARHFSLAYIIASKGLEIGRILHARTSLSLRNHLRSLTSFVKRVHRRDINKCFLFFVVNLIGPNSINH